MSVNRVAKPERFYGDPIERFRAMSKSTGGCDEVHFRLWCGVAADELEYSRYLVEVAAKKLTDALAMIAERAKGE